MPLVPFGVANDVGDRFLELLRHLKIDPSPQANMDDELLSLANLVEIARNRNTAPNVEVLRTAAGLHDLAAKVLAVEPINEFSKFIPHLRLIGSAKLPAHLMGKGVAAGLLGQNAESRNSDDLARKIAELYVACLIAHVAHDIELDDPTNAKGDNPDILFTIRPDENAPPTRWALAIKTISTQNGQTIFERIREGTQQIDSPRCSADRGMVLINAKTALNQEALWAPVVPFATLGEACLALKAQLEGLVRSAEENRPAIEWDELFRAKTARPILFLGQTMVKVPIGGALQPTQLKMLMQYTANGQMDVIAGRLAHQMNHFMQTVLIGRPGGSGVNPQ